MQTLSSNNPVIIIPAYQPSAVLITLVNNLLNANAQQKIIVINDGSTDQTTEIFSELEKLDRVKVLHHAINLGKGQALKTAFNYYLVHWSHESQGVVTADADGQHSVKDIQAVIKQLTISPNVVWLGSRTLNKNVPLRSRFGNTLTRKIFHLIMRKPVYDTQTGLRGLPKKALPELLQITASRYEYELDMLMRMIQKKIEIKEIPIETIYIDGNSSSHFNPLLDSLKVYFVFLRYLAASLSSALVDFIGFVLLHLMTQQLFTSLAGARVISGIFNFLLCKKMIFKSGGHTWFEAGKYLLLALFSLALSYILVLGLVQNCGLNLYVSKVIADISVFLINFAIQKVLIFPISQAIREK